MTADATPLRCADCAFWAHFNDSVGVCRRRAPRPAGGTDVVAHWPETYAEEGCGEGVRGAASAVTQVCGDCAHWRPGRLESGLEPADLNEQPRAWWRKAGRCTRHAPLPLTSPGVRLVWAASHATDACGEGKPRNPKPDASDR